MRFEIEGKSEVVTTNSIQSFENARLPRDLRKIYLSAGLYQSDDKINVYISEIDSGFFTYSNIEVSGQDTDWVSGRIKELEDFIFDHKNFHWLFQNWGWIIFQIIILSTLLGYLLRDNKLGILIAVLTGYAYFFIVRKIFPTVVLDTGRPSTLKTTRKILIWLIPAIFVSLLVHLLDRLIPIG